jgi:periplasmic protein TonB
VQARPFLFARHQPLALSRCPYQQTDFTLEDTMVESAALNSLFTDSMLETSWAQRARRSWTTLTSFGLQVVALGLLLLLPVLKTVGLPSTRTVSTPITLGRRSTMPLAASPHPAAHYAAHNNLAPPRLVAPGHVPRIIATVTDDPAPPIPDGPGGPLGNAFPDGVRDGPLIPSISGPSTIVPILRQTVTHVIRTSNMLEGNLIRRIEPAYPQMAKIARIQGPVVLVAIISKAGTIENLHAVSGHPLLVPAAVNAVSQWRYRPYILNSEPIEVETQITVNFYLSGN